MANTILVRELSARKLSPEFLEQWEVLQSRALEPNPFLSPRFVLPALRNLPSESGRDPLVLALHSAKNDELLGLGLFLTSPPTRLLPLRHLRSWKSIHSFLDGVVLHGDRAHEVATALFRWIGDQRDRWHGVSFRDRTAGSPQALCLEQAAAELGIPWREDWRGKRAAIDAREIPADPPRGLYAPRRRKEMERRRRILGSGGPVAFSLEFPRSGEAGVLDAFLELEGMGWKGDEGTALNSNEGSERFVREMVEGFSQTGEVLFPILTSGEDRVAIALVLRCGDTIFAFKSGYDTSRHRGSPGVLLKVDLLEALKGMPEITALDSCAMPGSWVEPIWPWRKRLTTGVFPTTSAGRILSALTLGGKRLKRRLKRLGSAS